MEQVNNARQVQKQYEKADQLQVRIRLHAKYSTNKEPFGRWIYKQYALEENMRMLEVGCGDGSMWGNADALLPRGTQLVLTDFSAGMLEAARGNARGEKISFLQADVQKLPFEDETFDAVFANMMLYHVPDIHKGLHEIVRVLKKGGRMYAATYGENGISGYLGELLSGYGVKSDMNRTFTLQNGGEILQRHFQHVEMRTREDGLAITDKEDFLNYIFSMTAMMGAADADRDSVRKLLDARMQDGVIYIPKEYGMFVCTK